MPSALDLRLEAAYNLITGPGGPIQVGTVERFGRELPFIANAPTNLGDYVAFFAAQHGDATFLVEGDELGSNQNARCLKRCIFFMRSVRRACS